MAHDGPADFRQGRRRLRASVRRRVPLVCARRIQLTGRDGPGTDFRRPGVRRVLGVFDGGGFRHRVAVVETSEMTPRMLDPADPRWRLTSTPIADSLL